MITKKNRKKQVAKRHLRVRKKFSVLLKDLD